MSPFFKELDRVTHANYARVFGYGNRTTEGTMVEAMANLAALHGLGVLVIDEVQRLNSAKSGGAQKMLDFFTELMNTMGVPIVLVATPKAIDTLTAEFRQGRRGCGLGDEVWDRLEEGEQWHEFLELLWPYQYTKKPANLHKAPDRPAQETSNAGATLYPADLQSQPHEEPKLPSDLSSAIYNQCQGIVDLAVKVFVLAQERAIDTGNDCIDGLIVDSAAKDGLRELQPTIRALRDKDYDALRAAHPDVVIDYIDLHMLQVLRALDEQKKKGKKGLSIKGVATARGSKAARGSVKRGGATTKSQAKAKTRRRGTDATWGPGAIEDNGNSPKGVVSIRKGSPAYTPVPGGLIEAVTEGREKGLSAHEALQQAGHTASGDFPSAPPQV